MLYLPPPQASTGLDEEEDWAGGLLGNGTASLGRGEPQRISARSAEPGFRLQSSRALAALQAFPTIVGTLES